MRVELRLSNSEFQAPVLPPTTRTAGCREVFEVLREILLIFEVLRDMGAQIVILPIFGPLPPKLQFVLK